MLLKLYCTETWELSFELVILPNFRIILFSIGILLGTYASSSGQQPPNITFNWNFEGGILGKIEKLGDTTFRCFVPGQTDEHGRNRQANWYYFRMDGVRNRDLKLTLTDFLGEYDNKPGACPMTSDTIPVFSYDNEHWQNFPAMVWDDQRKEATLHFRPEKDRLWIAHIPPYTPARLDRVLAELDTRPCVRVEVIGKTAQGRELRLITITDPEQSDSGKKTVWLQARQHAWEAGTSYVMEGALRFISSDDANAQELRRRVIFKFIPMMDPDGCTLGRVRFNANGYDVNRHWDEIDLHTKRLFQLMPEIWYVKKAIVDTMHSSQPIDLMLNLHNNETNEYMETEVDDADRQIRLKQFFDSLANQSTFDPSQPLSFSKQPGNNTNSLWRQHRVPVLLLEQRISTSKKLGRHATTDDRLQFGAQLITTMGEAVAR